MNKKVVLQSITFGKRIAEEEVGELRAYFVETDLWRRIFAGDIDVVYGPKGSGKSAIYSLLLDRSDDLAGRGILVVAAENPRGATAFRDLVADPPASEEEFRGLWKLYFLSLLAGVLRDRGLEDDAAKRVSLALESAGLVSRGRSLQSLLRAVADHAKAIVRAESLEGGVKLDPTTGLPAGLSGKITLREPSQEARRNGATSADELLRLVDESLQVAQLSVWLLIDRLDIAFAENSTLEQNALRALFHVYLDMLGLTRVALKIFLRTDIWKRITLAGFREASHITRQATIDWNTGSLMNLVIRRALRNEQVRTGYSVSEPETLADAMKQQQLFYRMFPAQVDAGPNKPFTFEWMLSRTRDGSTATAPRELIHLLDATRGAQLRDLEVGGPEPASDALFSGAALKSGLPEVSRARLEQTLFAEYPQLKTYLEQLEGEKTQQSPGTLSRVWRVSEADASQIAGDLVEIGFFERRGTKDAPLYWVPFLYRDALSMVQGAAD